LGGLHRLPKIVGSQGWLREVIFTGRVFDAQEGFQYGLISRVFETKEDMWSNSAQVIHMDRRTIVIGKGDC
jgi:enoyl-CoA hydratase/carnithine racemase